MSTATGWPLSLGAPTSRWDRRRAASIRTADRPVLLLHFPYVRIRPITTRMAILSSAMRRLVLLALVVALVLPMAAWAAASLPGDGTLVVDNGNGLVTI